MSPATTAWTASPPAPAAERSAPLGPTARHLSRREVAVVGLVLAAAALVRVWRVDLAQVGYDESSAASLVAAWQHDGRFPLMGIVSSTGIPNPPAWPYLLALGLLPFGGPYAAVALGIATGLVSVGLTWAIGRRWFGPWGGVAAAAFYAGGFWSILLGRSPWQPAFLQVPTLLCLDALLLLALRRRAWALAAACGWLALMVQLHYIAAAYAVLVPIAAWPARRVLRPVHVAAAAVCAVLPLVPFLLYELHPAVRGRELAFVLGQAAGGSRVDLEAWGLLWTLAGNGGVAGLGGPSVDDLRILLGRWASAGLIGVALLASGLLAAAFGGPMGWRRPWAGWLILMWVLVPVVALARHTLGVLFHYLYLDLPGMALAVGVAAGWAARTRWRVLPLAMVGSLAAYAIVSAATLWVVLDFVDRRDAHLGYGMPLRFSLAAGEAARAAVPVGGQVLVGGRPFDAEVLRFTIGYQVPSRIFDDCREVPPLANGVYLLMRQDTPGGAALAQAAAQLLARVERPGDVYLVYGAPPRPPSLSASGAC